MAGPFASRFRIPALALALAAGAHGKVTVAEASAPSGRSR